MLDEEDEPCARGRDLGVRDTALFGMEGVFPWVRIREERGRRNLAVAVKVEKEQIIFVAEKARLEDAVGASPFSVSRPRLPTCFNFIEVSRSISYRERGPPWASAVVHEVVA
jgi:hypothetical protein